MERPDEKFRLKKPNISGIVYVIDFVIDSEDGSADGMVINFCWKNIEAATNTGRM